MKTLMTMALFAGITSSLLAQAQTPAPTPAPGQGGTPPAGKQDSEARHPFFKEMDANQDGKVSQDEFVTFHLAKAQARATKEGRTIDVNVRTAEFVARFKEIDANNDGSIALAEWETWCKAHPHPGGHGGGNRGGAQQPPAGGVNPVTGQATK